MLANVLRDAVVMEAVDRNAQVYRDFVASVARSLAPRRRLMRAACLHALSFPTWQSLVREGGLSPRDAVDLMVGMVAASAPPPS
jgi:hypothetical protein